MVQRAYCHVILRVIGPLLVLTCIHDRLIHSDLWCISTHRATLIWAVQQNSAKAMSWATPLFCEEFWWHLPKLRFWCSVRVLHESSLWTVRGTGVCWRSLLLHHTMVFLKSWPLRLYAFSMWKKRWFLLWHAYAYSCIHLFTQKNNLYHIIINIVL